MKTIHISFLFFYFSLSILILYSSKGLYAQENKKDDSLKYYSHLAFRSKKSTDITSAYTFFKQRSKAILKRNDTLNIIHDL